VGAVAVRDWMFLPGTFHTRHYRYLGVKTR